MITQEINLKSVYPYLKNEAKLQQFVMSDSKEYAAGKRYPAMIICPGGAYAFTSDREAEPIALKFLAHGINCFVLRYTVAPQVVYPNAHQELAAAFAFVRDHAEEYRIDPNAIGVIGFSAGGHLVGSYAAGLWHSAGYEKVLGVDVEKIKPNAAVLSYGVLTTGQYTHEYSMECLLGENDTPENRKQLSTDNLVGEHTPPTFLWHTFEDDAVPVENSLLTACALAKNKVHFEMHIYPDCGHGLGTADRLTTVDDNWLPPKYIARWTDDCADWFLRLTGHQNN